MSLTLSLLDPSDASEFGDCKSQESSSDSEINFPSQLKSTENKDSVNNSIEISTKSEYKEHISNKNTANINIPPQLIVDCPLNIDVEEEEEKMVYTSYKQSRIEKLQLLHDKSKQWEDMLKSISLQVINIYIT